MKEESSHWYRANGDACHSVPTSSPKAKSKTRPVKITDAIQLGLYPSVTTILSVMAKPQLDKWKQKQVQDATRRMLAQLVAVQDGKQPTAQDVDYLRILVAPDITKQAEVDLVAQFQEKCIEEAFRPVEEAADAGTLIHGGAELALQGKDYEEDAPVYLPALKENFPLKTFVEPIKAFVEENEIRITGNEVRTVNHNEGYAGTIDAPMRSKRGLGILDFKTRKTDPRYPCDPYDGQPMQIAAYHVSHYGCVPEADTHVAGCNLYVSTTEPGRVEAVWYDGATLAREWDAFTHVAALWRHIKKYDPRGRRPE